MNSQDLIAKILNFIVTLEENVEYHWNVVKSTRSNKNLEIIVDHVQEALKILKADKERVKYGLVHSHEDLNKMIRYYMPDLILKENFYFVITRSPVYRKFTEMQKCVLFLDKQNAWGHNEAVNIPDRLYSQVLEKGVGRFIEITQDGKYFLLEGEGGALLTSIDRAISTISFDILPVEDFFTIHFSNDIITVRTSAGKATTFVEKKDK